MVITRQITKLLREMIVEIIVGDGRKMAAGGLETIQDVDRGRGGNRLSRNLSGNDPRLQLP